MFAPENSGHSNDRRRRAYPNISWHENGMTFETMREADECANAVVYNEIGNLYDGCRTADQEIAACLVVS